MMMRTSHAEYLESLEQIAASCKSEEFYLWPKTPVENLQLEIEQTVGVSDYQIENSHSRPIRIIKQLKVLINNGLIPDEFSVLDICCGDAIVLWQIKKAFPKAFCYGIDFLKGKIATHQTVQADGVQLYRAFIQHLFQMHPGKPFDLAIMLNTYRDWNAADLPEHERELPELADTWFVKNARYVILTASWIQLKHLQRLGFRIIRLGRGEKRSAMVCISKYKFPILSLLSNNYVVFVSKIKTMIRILRRALTYKAHRTK